MRNSFKVCLVAMYLLGLLSIVLYYVIIDFTADTNYYLPGSLDWFHNLSKPPLLPAVSLDACDLNNSYWQKKVIDEDVFFTSQVWVSTDTNSHVFVYSAYFDVSDNGVSFVRVIGVGLQHTFHNIVCVVQMSANSTCLETVPTSVQIMPDTHDKKYATLFVDCKMSQKEKPYAVSVTGTGHTQLRNRLLVQYPKSLRFNITTCFPCLHSDYDDEAEAIQSIEMDKLLGVEHFVVYSFSVGSSVQSVLKHYSKRKVLEIRSWNLPRILVHYLGQMAAINDCLYSNRGLSKYVVVKDMDEVLVPYEDRTLPVLLNRTMAKYPSAASVVFQNSFFLKTLPYDEEEYKASQRAKQLRLHLLLKIWRQKRIYPHTVRSKVIYKPERVQLAGIHFAWKLRKGFVRVELPSSEGLLHHYREMDSDVEKVREDFLRIYTNDLIEKCNITFTLIHSNSDVRNNSQRNASHVHNNSHVYHTANLINNSHINNSHYHINSHV